MKIDKQNLTYNNLIFKKPILNSQKFPLHSHNNYEFLFFKKGEGDYIIEERKYNLKKNDLVFTRAGKYHYLEIDPSIEYERINISFDNTIISEELISKINESVDVVNCPKESVIGEIFGRMEYYESNLNEDDFCSLLPALLNEIFFALSISYKDGITIPSEISPILTKALKYINDNLFSIKCIQEISDNIFVSEQYLFRLFQTELKTSPKKYLNTKRLLHAQKMIQRGKKPIETYLQCGFETYVGFYKQYLKTFGYPPSKERNLS